METLVQIIFISAILEYGLKASKSLKTLTLYALFMGLWAVMVYPFVIALPVSIAEQLLSDKGVVADATVLTTIEAIAGITFSVKMTDAVVSKRSKVSSLFTALKALPGALVMIGIPYFELLFFKMRIVADFLTGTFLYVFLIATTLLCIGFAFRRYCTERMFVAEMKLILNAIIMGVGLLINCAVADHAVSRTHAAVEWLPLLTMTVLTTGIIFLGTFSHKFNLSQLFKRFKQ